MPPHTKVPGWLSETDKGVPFDVSVLGFLLLNQVCLVHDLDGKLSVCWARVVGEERRGVDGVDDSTITAAAELFPKDEVTSGRPSSRARRGGIGGRVAWTTFTLGALAGSDSTGVGAVIPPVCS